MSIITKEIEIIGDKGKRKVKALFDSGASDSLVRKDTVKEIATLLKHSKPKKFVLGDGKTFMESEYTTDLELWINGNDIPPWQFFIVEEMEDELILGADAFQRWKFKLDFEKEDVIIDKNALRLRLV